MKLCGGIGINDADYQVTRYVSEAGKRRRVWVCPYYSRWKCLMERLGPFSKYPAYVDKSCCDDWLYFTKFRGWMEGQYWEDLHLDKDILSPGNKVYSPETCAFVPHWINTLLATNAFRKGKEPLGVAVSYSGLYRAQVSNVLTNTNLHLGLFNTPYEAHVTWQVGKIEQIEKALWIYRSEKCYCEDIDNALKSRIENIKKDIIEKRETIKL